MKYFIFICLACFQLKAFADVLIFSNKPLYDLFNQIKNPELELHLIAQQGSTHSQDIQPSEMKLIPQADSFFIIKPFDNSIEKIAKNHHKNIIILNNLSSHILSLRNPHNHEHEDEHEHGQHEDEHSHHDKKEASRLYHEQDSHFWLSPFVVKDIITQLNQQYPLWFNEEKYNEFMNYIALMEAQRDKQNKQPHWLVYHDGWQYLEKFFGLDAPVIFTQDPQSLLRPKDFQHALEAQQKQSFQCIIVEPSINKRALQKISQSFKGQIITLDPTGKTAPQGENSLYWIWENYYKAMQNCTP